MTLEAFHKLDFPSTPGVYFFKEGDNILYIGKATNLKQRVGSYFSSSLMEARGPVITKMVDEATTVLFEETSSSLEALLLESRLIKKHQPPYNTKEKDNKSYNYVVITDENLPRVFTVRKRQLDLLLGRKEPLLHVFGPFPQGQLLRDALKIIRKIFPFYGKQGRGSYADDFYEQLGLIPGSTQAQDQYLENISYLALFFEGKKKTILNNLKKTMMTYADQLAFEKAEAIKRQIYALEHIQDIALMRKEFESTFEDGMRMEAYDIAHLQGSNMVGVMVVSHGGEFSPEDYRTFNITSVDTSNDIAALKETLSRRLNHTEWPFPSLIIADGNMTQKRALESVIKEHNLTIPVVAVVKDDTHKAKGLLGQKKLIEKYQQDILKLNLESHRFALKTHTNKRKKNFLPGE